MITEIMKNRIVKGCLQSHTPFIPIPYAFLTIPYAPYASMHSHTPPYTPYAFSTTGSQAMFGFATQHAVVY